MHYKRLLILFFLFILTLSFKGTVFSAKINCQTYKNTCPDESLIPQIKKSCGSSILDSIYATCAKEKSEAQKRMSELSDKKEDIEKEEGNVNWYLSNLDYEIKDINAEIVNAEASLDEIDEALSKINKILNQQKGTLSVTLRQVYEYDTNSYIEIFLGNKSLAEFSNKIAEVEDIQKRLGYSVRGVRELKEKLEKKRREQLRYKEIQKLSRESLASKRYQKEYLLSELKKAKTPIEREMARINAELRELRLAMSSIQSYLGNWLMGQRPTWAQIFSAINGASSTTGVRKALLLAVLETESRYGTGLGVSGKYKEYCNWGWSGKTHLDVLVEICKNYGYDPAKVPMSPRCAIGPAQFVPLTWKGYMGLKNPWNLYDAIMGMAVYLKKNGATSGNEESAVYRYNHSQSYVGRVMSRASTWQSIINICGLDLNCPEMREKLEASGIPLR